MALAVLRCLGVLLLLGVPQHLVLEHLLAQALHSAVLLDHRLAKCSERAPRLPTWEDLGKQDEVFFERFDMEKKSIVVWLKLTLEQPKGSATLIQGGWTFSWTLFIELLSASSLSVIYFLCLLWYSSGIKAENIFSRTTFHWQSSVTENCFFSQPTVADNEYLKMSLSSGYYCHNRRLSVCSALQDKPAESSI